MSRYVAICRGLSQARQIAKTKPPDMKMICNFNNNNYLCLDNPLSKLLGADDRPLQQVFGAVAHRAEVWSLGIQRSKRRGVAALENRLAQRVIERDDFGDGDSASCVAPQK